MRKWASSNPGEPIIEQCCFVTLPQNPEATARVEMFGGEFCGNAIRSVAWLVAGGEDYEGLIEVSGAECLLKFEVKDGQVNVEMPMPTSKDLAIVTENGALVQLDGITQLVVTDQGIMRSQASRECLINLLNKNAYNLAEQPAVGVTYYDPVSGKAEFCVWVKEVDTIFDETACGSGTSAIGIARAIRQKKSVNCSVIQPSGELITTTAAYGAGKVTKSTISGTVGILYDGEFALS